MLPITNAIMNHWNVDVKCLLRLAHQNTPRLFPVVCNALEEVVRQLVDEEEFASLCSHELAYHTYRNLSMK